MEKGGWSQEKSKVFVRASKQARRWVFESAVRKNQDEFGFGGSWKEEGGGGKGLVTRAMGLPRPRPEHIETLEWKE